jgi:Pre ATP-grasp domain
MSDSVELIVPNVSEFNLRNFSTRPRKEVERSFVGNGDMLSDQAVFWSVAPRVLVLPGGVDADWFADVHRVLGVERPPVISPVPRTGRLIADLLADDSALTRLRAALGDRHTRIMCFGATPGVYQLLAAVEAWGVDVDLEGPAKQDYWSSLYLDNKLSCLDLAGRVAGFRVPSGITVTTPEELEGALRAVLAHGDRAIVKSMHGISGDGSIVVHRDEVDAFWGNVYHDHFLHTFPVFVQPYIGHAEDAGCPAVDVRVADDGVETVVLSTMTVDVKRYLSVSVGARFVPPDVADRLCALGNAVGAAAHALGFRGWLCADCIVDRDRELYVTEINARRSGAMHPIALVAHRGGESRGLVAHSHDSIPVRPEGGPISYAAHIRPLFEELWSQGVTALPTAIRGLSRSTPIFAATAVTGNPETARAVIADIEGRARAEQLLR